MRNCIVFCICLALLLAAMPGEIFASVDLQITEMYAGTTPKTPGIEGTFDTTEWFEVTNFGDTDADIVTNPLYYDDESCDPTKNCQLLGVDTIAAGESVVFLLDWESDLLDSSATYEEKLELAYDLFAEAWGELPGVQIGNVDIGAGGLGSNGDTMYLFDSNQASAGLVDYAGYSIATLPSSGTYVSQPDGTWNGMDAGSGGDGGNDIAGVDVPGWEAKVQFGSDAEGWITLFGSPGAVEAIPGDANCDGKVDGSDVTILAGNWQMGVSDGLTAAWADGDFNSDGKVDGSDVTILAGNWQYGVSVAAAAVPEPSTFVLLFVAIGSFLIWKRRS